MSNGQEMKFFWNNDQLRIKYGKIKNLSWTTFEMDLKNPEKVNNYLLKLNFCI